MAKCNHNKEFQIDEKRFFCDICREWVNCEGLNGQLGDVGRTNQGGSTLHHGQLTHPHKKYNLIVIDPPWKVKKIRNKQRPNQIEMDYPLMDNEEIKELPINEIAEENSYCFLWTTQKYLFQAKEILENWGFNHLLTMVWEKTYGVSAGMPLYGFRWNAEFILVGTKGKKVMFPKRKLIPSVFQAENIRHSEKPQLFYDLISQLGEKRIDLFARKKRHGWDVWGNEVESDIDLKQGGGLNSSHK